MLGIYLFNKITVSPNNGLDMANRTKALTTMSLSMMVNTSMMEATRLALML